MMYQFKIDNILLHSTEGDLPIEPKSINIIVGPNNSGKSRLLKELRDYLSGDHRDIKMISDVVFPFPEKLTELDAVYEVESRMFQDRYGNWMLKAYNNKPNEALDMTSSLENYFTRNLNTIGGDWHTYYEQILERKDEAEFLNWFGALFFQYIGTEERLTICKSQHNYGLDSSSTNYLSSFRYNGELLNQLSNKVKQLFKKELYLDTETMGERLVFRAGEDFEYVRGKSISNATDAKKLFEESTLDEQGDGMKSFVSTFLALNLEKCDVLLLDEPEAFLHPPLARQLGEMIGELQRKNRTIFIATHSVEVLKGVLSKCQDVNVIRITQPRPHVNEIKVLKEDVLKTILQDPLLRVSRVLEGVFCEKVVITEAEADELVYQELIEKVFPESGLFFAHGQNKQTLSTIAKLYQEIGIAYEIITDFDVLRKPSEFYSFLKLMPIEEKERQRLQNYAVKLRDLVNASVDISGLSAEEQENAQKSKRAEVYHKQGIRFFDEKMATLIWQTIEQLGTYHLHILKNGELETLLEDYGVKYQEKNKWIVAAINRIAELKKEDIDEESPLYYFLNRVVNNNRCMEN